MRFGLYIKVLLFIFLVSCKNEKNNNEKVVKGDNIENIQLNDSNSKGLGEKGNFDDYFDAYNLIPLETNSSSVISKISRIYFYDYP